MRPRVVLIGVTFLVTIVAAVLWLHGTDEEGLRAAIRTTARTSALCVGLAFARIRVRELSVLLPVSHAMHYVLILNTDRVIGWPELVVGVSVFAAMLWNAWRPHAAALYILWIAFLVAFLRPGVLYGMIVTLLLSCGVVRWFPRTRETIA